MRWMGLGLELRLDLVSGWFVVMHTYFFYFPLSLSLQEYSVDCVSAVICSYIKLHY